MTSSASRGVSRFFPIVFFTLTAPAFAQLERCLDAHGGLAKWKEYAGVEYDVGWSTPKGDTEEHQIFDLRSRDGLIKSDKYTLGSSHGEVWIKPSLDALAGTPPRFYMWTSFYFFGMPFVFADRGAHLESIGRKMFQGQEYDVTKITFQKGTGDSPDDYYVAYTAPKSGELKLVYYIVTYPTMRKNKPLDELETTAIVFQEWQRADGLLVPKTGPIYVWKDDNIQGEAKATLQISNVRFSKNPPDASRFAKPAAAVIAPLQ